MSSTLADVEMPALDDDQVLVRVRAASVNAVDWRPVRPAPLAPEGTLVLVGAGAGAGGPIGRLVGGIFRTGVLKQRLIMFMANITMDDLLTLKELVEAGKLTPVIDRTFPLRATADAIRYVETGRARGKVAITM